MLMEYADGQTLEQLMADKSLGMWDDVRCIRQVLAAPNMPMDWGVIHRDIKPAIS